MTVTRSAVGRARNDVAPRAHNTYGTRRPVRTTRNHRHDPGLFDAPDPLGQILESVRQPEAIAPDMRVHTIQPRHRAVVSEQADRFDSAFAGNNASGDGGVGFG